MYKFFLFFILFFSTLSADFLQVNSPVAGLNDFEYKTPNNKIVNIPKETKIIIATFEKEAGVLVNEYLDDKNVSYLKDHDTVFVADISAMPTIFINMFGLAKLQKYKHPIHVNYSEEFSSVVPNKEGSATLLLVKDSKIKEILYASTKEELKKAIEK